MTQMRFIILILAILIYFIALPNETSAYIPAYTTYGGIGNKFRIEFTLGLTGAKRDIRIEPVGVIVIGIDGLRQDVLYPDAIDAVKDGGQYRVDIGSLA